MFIERWNSSEHPEHGTALQFVQGSTEKYDVIQGFRYDDPSQTPQIMFHGMHFKANLDQILSMLW